jgi:recombination protein RecA
MPSQRRRKLDALVTQLQFEHGPRAIRRAEPGERAPAVARIPTTFTELDALLDGGLPRGRISEVTGPATSGKLTLAAKVISAAHRERDAVAAWIDTWRTFDADYMHRCGVDLSRLLVVRPASLVDALAMALHLVESRSLAVLVMDTLPSPEPGEKPGSGEAVLSGALSRLAALLTETQTVALFLTDPEQYSQALAHAAVVRLNIRRERWITRERGLTGNRDVRGYEGQTELVKNRLGRTGTAHIRITFNGTVRGDGL